MIKLKSLLKETTQENNDLANLILYHGTNNNFNKFDLKFFNVGSGDGGWLGYGVYLTNDYEYAESYGDVLECKVTLDNPYILEDYAYSTQPNRLSNELNVNNSREVTNKLKEMGYDSVILTYKDETYGRVDVFDEFIEVCIFNASNIQIIERHGQGDIQ